jgi:2-polyprenyl-3-methyl-5-hydroxy-6-metoxy-1,4-benzoquinol methylase
MSHMNTRQITDFKYPYADKFVEKQIEFMKILKLPLNNKKVLEVGCGPYGEYTQFLMDNNAIVTSCDIRDEHLQSLCNRFNGHNVFKCDMNTQCIKDYYDCIFALGILYHLDKPDVAIKHMSEHCSEYLFISTATSQNENGIIFVNESTTDTAQAYNGRGCRPSKKWIINELKKYYKYVYSLLHNPDIDEFKVNLRCILLGTNNIIDNMDKNWILH